MLMYTVVVCSSLGVAAVNDSWKFAAVEICNMLHKVRDSGSSDMHLLELKVQELLTSMNQQAEMIEELNQDLRKQKEVGVCMSTIRVYRCTSEYGEVHARELKILNWCYKGMYEGHATMVLCTGGAHADVTVSKT